MQNAYENMNSICCSVCGSGMVAQGTDTVGAYTVWCQNVNCAEHNVKYSANAPLIPLTPVGGA